MGPHLAGSDRCNKRAIGPHVLIDAELTSGNFSIESCRELMRAKLHTGARDLRTRTERWHRDAPWLLAAVGPSAIRSTVLLVALGAGATWG